MTKFKEFARQFHWKIFLIRLLVNAAALTLTVLIIPDIYFENQSFWAVLVISVSLGILNAVVKPVILLLTGQFIFVTFGLLVILVNSLILYLLKWLFPGILVVQSLFWALIAGVVLGLVSNALENLLGLTPPIVPEENQELRKKLEAEQPAPLFPLVAKPRPVMQPDVETQSVSELEAAKATSAAASASASADAEAVLDLIQAKAAPDSNTPPENENVSELSETDLPAPGAAQNQNQGPQADETNSKSGGAA